MIRPFFAAPATAIVPSSTLTVVLCPALLPSSGRSQTIDTARVRADYSAVTALRRDIERSHGWFVTVNGIRMHYLEWGEPNGVPLVWDHGSASGAYEIRGIAPHSRERVEDRPASQSYTRGSMDALARRLRSEKKEDMARVIEALRDGR